MKADNITLEVKAKLTVDKETAEAALKLVQIYLNSHKDIELSCKTNGDGEWECNYEPA